nr:ferric/cupric reductase transmembrane component 2 [Quercus suber]
MGYHFVDLNDEQKLARRQALDWYSFVAQASVLLPLLLAQVYFTITWVDRRWRKSTLAADSPGSPHLKQAQLGYAQTWRARAIKWAWWSGESVTVFGDRLGSRIEVLCAVSWFAWLVALSFIETGDDYLHLTKRFGIVAASQLPLHYLLALKSPYSPLLVAFRSSHETMNTAHQLLGRVVTILIYAHTILYLNFYVQKSLLAAKLQEFYVLCGLFAATAFTVVGTTALAPVRRWSYKVFYTAHVALAIALLPVLWFHVSHIRIYLYETAAVFALNAILRTLSSRVVAGTIRVIPDTNLVEIIVPENKTPGIWHAGQHAYLSLPGHPFLRTFRSNPFTVASLPSLDGQLRFVARILDGNTARLAQSVKGAGEQRVTVEGPYGVATHIDRLLQYDRVLLVAGGVGGTFIVPLYRQLLADLSPGSGTYRRSKVDFLWAVKRIGDVTWALSEDTKDRASFAERLTLYVTRSEAASTTDIAGHESFVVGEDDQGIELEERKNLLADAGNQAAGGGDSGLVVHARRPDLAATVAQTFAHGRQERVAVVVCGPRGLSTRIRSEVGKHVRHGREVWFWDESFGL